MSYQYPDTTDQITAIFIKDNEPYQGYWEESEREALVVAGAKLKGNKAARTALDAGCGEGRLLPWLSQYASKVTAIEPDTVRLAVAQKNPANNDVHFLPHSINEHQGSYEIVLCSHIIQHLPTSEVQPMLTRLYELTAPGGMLVMMCSRASIGGGSYSLESLKNNKTVSKKVDKAGFNNAFTTAEASGVLPVHYFDPDELQKQAESIGWEEMLRWSFHVMDKEIFDGKKSPDKMVNQDPQLRQKFGRDMLVIWWRPTK